MRRVIILLAVLTVAGSVCFARDWWDRKSRPPMTIVQAAEIAHKALGADTNRFYCVSAFVGTNGLGVGFWNFDFSSKTGEQRVIAVGFDGKTRFFPAPNL